LSFSVTRFFAVDAGGLALARTLQLCQDDVDGQNSFNRKYFQVAREEIS
jgi:hypothetical protein